MAEDKEKTEDIQKVPEWKRKWIASRMAFESILFERELLTKKKEKDHKGPIFLALLFVFQAALLYLYFHANSGLLSGNDAEKIKIAADYSGYFSSGRFMDIFKSGNILKLNFDMPFYYFSFIPVIKYVTSDPAMAIFAVNSFYLFLIILSAYLLIARNRNYQSALLGAAFASSLPFVAEAARHFSPQMATFSFVLFAYTSFIKSEDFENHKWLFPMALSIALGLLSDKFFLFYVLPILPWLNYAFAGMYRWEIFKALAPGLVLAFPFYLRFFSQLLFSYVLRGQVFLGVKNFAPFWYLKPSIGALHLFFFTIGSLCLLWMYFSLFMPYDKRKVVGKWFAYSYVFFWLFPYKEPFYIYPALLPMAIAAGIMTPNIARRYLFGAVLGLSFLNQTGIMPRFYLGSGDKVFAACGLEKYPSRSEKIDEVMTVIKENLPYPGAVVSVYGQSDYINVDSLSSVSSRYGIPAARFVNYPEGLLSFADLVIVKGSENLSKLPDQFKSLFASKISFNSGDLTVFVKNKTLQTSVKGLSSYKIPELNLMGIKFSEISLSLGEFDQAKGVYKKASAYISYANINDIDAYGIGLDFEDFCLAEVDGKPVICGFSNVKINRLKFTDFSIARFIEKNFTVLNNVEVVVDKNIRISGYARKKDFLVEALVYSSGGEISFSFQKLEYDGYGVPDVFYDFLNFKIRKSDFPIPVEIKNIRFRSSMLEIS